MVNSPVSKTLVPGGFQDFLDGFKDIRRSQLGRLFQQRRMKRACYQSLTLCTWFFPDRCHVFFLPAENSFTIQPLCTNQQFSGETAVGQDLGQGVS